MSVWPKGILSRVSREAYDATTRARGFALMTPTERENAARSYDALTGRSPAPRKESPVVATWAKENGTTMTLHENGDLIGRLTTGRTVRMNMRAPGNARRTRWTLDEAQRRAEEYGFKPVEGRA